MEGVVTAEVVGAEGWVRVEGLVVVGMAGEVVQEEVAWVVKVGVGVKVQGWGWVAEARVGEVGRVGG
jgi:hypothetical protein